MISALLINLEKSSNRLGFQKLQLEKLHIPMHRLEAVKCTDFNSKKYEDLANGWQRKLRKTEVACFLSHKKAWEYVLESGVPWLILEDDALLSKRCSDILNELVVNKKNFDYVNLETRNRRKWIGKDTINLVEEYGLRRLYQDRNGSAAYVLFPSGAQKLLEKAKKSSPALADAFLSQTYELNAWQIYPAAAFQMDQCKYYDIPPTMSLVSTIASDKYSRPKANNGFDYFHFKLRRIKGQIQMAKRQFMVHRIAEHKFVPIVQSDFIY